MSTWTVTLILYLSWPFPSPLPLFPIPPPSPSSPVPPPSPLPLPSQGLGGMHRTWESRLPQSFLSAQPSPAMRYVCVCVPCIAPPVVDAFTRTVGLHCGEHPRYKVRGWTIPAWAWSGVHNVIMCSWRGTSCVW